MKNFILFYSLIIILTLLIHHDYKIGTNTKSVSKQTRFYNFYPSVGEKTNYNEYHYMPSNILKANFKNMDTNNLSPEKTMQDGLMWINKNNFNKKEVDEFMVTGYCYKGNLKLAHIVKKTINNAFLKYVDLSRADLSDSIFFEGDFIRCKFTKSIAINSIFRKANIIEAEMSEANFEGADFTDACLLKSRMINTILRNTNMDNADLRKVIFYQADLTGASFIGANLENADMRYAKLKGSNLTGANLSGVNFTGANLSGADFTGAYIKKTIWNNGKIYSSNNLHDK